MKDTKSHEESQPSVDTAAQETPVEIDPVDGFPVPVDVQPEGASSFDPALETLMGDLRDVMLMRIRTMPKVWAQMSEADQCDMANGIELAAKDMIRRMVRLLNDHEWPHTVVQLAEMNIKGGKDIVAKIVCGNIEHNRTVLGEHIGQHIMVLMVDSDTFMNERRPVEIDKDQPELSIDQQAA